MASKQSLKLFDIQNKLLSTYLKTVDWVKHDVLRLKRQVLIIGNGTDPLINSITSRLSSRCNVTLLDDAIHQPQT